MAHTTARALYHHDDLRRLINPGVVAVVGASETRGSFGERTLSNMADFTGKVFAINPKYRNLLGRPCVPSLADMPESPDCVVLCVARPMVEGMIEAAAAVKAGGVIVYASGFAETAKPDRIEAQQRLIELSQRTGVRVVGPNCVGLANTGSAAGLNFMPDYAGMGHRRGPIGIVSQSGALGYTVLQGMERGIGFSHYLAAGNSCDVDVCDFISYLAEDDDTKSIICLLEGVKDGDRFLQAARKARDAGKALIVYKTGNSETSSKAAMSHTGTMVGSVVAYQTAFEETGAIAIDDLEAVLETASFFAKTRAPTGGRGVGILSTSGGAAVICADKAEAHGVPLPALEAKTANALHEVVPDFGSVANPSDLTAEVLKTSETFGFCLDAFMNDAGFSALVMPMIFAHASSSGARAPTIVEAAARTDRPLAVVWMNEWYQGPGSELLDADPRVCMFRSADRCFATLRAWFDWHERRTSQAGARPRGDRRRRPGRPRAPSCPRRKAAARRCRRRIRSGSSPATASRSRRRSWRATPNKRPRPRARSAVRWRSRSCRPISCTRPRPAASGSACRRRRMSAKRPGISWRRPHAMRRRPGSTASACSRWRLRASRSCSASRTTVSSVRWWRPASAGSWSNCSAIPPCGLRRSTMRTARAMLASLKSHALLTGFRGKPGVDIDGLVDTICRLSELAHDLADVIDQIDVNPVIAGAAGVMAADALIVCR